MVVQLPFHFRFIFSKPMLFFISLLFSHVCIYYLDSEYRLQQSITWHRDTWMTVFVLKRTSISVVFLSSQNYILSLYIIKISHTDSYRKQMLILMTASFLTSTHYIKLFLKKWVEHTWIQIMNNEFLMCQNRAQIHLFVVHVYFISYIVWILTQISVIQWQCTDLS